MQTFQISKKSYLDRILSAPFEKRSETAGAALLVLESAAGEERLDLMEHILGTFGLSQPNTNEVKFEDLPRCGVTEEVYREVVGRISRSIDRLIARLSTSDFSCREVAKEVITHLDKLSGEHERTVGFALILYGDLVPYAPLPEDLFRDAITTIPDEVYCRGSVRTSRAQIVRICSSAAARLRLSEAEALTALRRIFERHTDPIEREAVFRTFISAIFKIGEAKGELQLHLKLATAVAQQIFGQQVKAVESADCGDPNCQAHPHQREQKSGETVFEATNPEAKPADGEKGEEPAATHSDDTGKKTFVN